MIGQSQKEGETTFQIGQRRPHYIRSFEVLLQEDGCYGQWKHLCSDAAHSPNVNQH